MRLDFINGLRGYAILAVIFHHMYGGVFPPGTQAFEWAGLLFSPLTPLANGWFGVNLFFVLSGFVLALPYFDGRRSFSRSGSIRWFYWRRAKRLLPLYYFSVILSMVFIMKITRVQEPIRDLLLMGTVTFNFLPETFLPSYNWVLWSLGLEVWFSLAFPFLMIGIHRFGIWKVGFAVALVALSTRFAGHGFPSDVGYLNPIKDSFLGRLDDFYTGILLCRLCVNGKGSVAPSGGGILMLAAGTVLCLVTFLGWDNVILGRLPTIVTPFLHVLSNAALFCIIYPLYHMSGTFRRVCFQNYPVMLLGVMCYSLYVWHGMPVFSMKAYGRSVENVPIYLSLFFLFSCLSYRYIEFGHVANGRALFLLADRSEESRG